MNFKVIVDFYVVFLNIIVGCFFARGQKIIVAPLFLSGLLTMGLVDGQ
jgi:hypothetical protein